MFGEVGLANLESALTIELMPRQVGLFTCVMTSALINLAGQCDEAPHRDSQRRQSFASRRRSHRFGGEHAKQQEQHAEKNTSQMLAEAKQLVESGQWRQAAAVPRRIRPTPSRSCGRSTTRATQVGPFRRTAVQDVCGIVNKCLRYISLPV